MSRVRQQLVSSIIEKAEKVVKQPQLKFFIPKVSTDLDTRTSSAQILDRPTKRRKTAATSPFLNLAAALQPRTPVKGQSASAKSHRTVSSSSVTAETAALDQFKYDINRSEQADGLNKKRKRPQQEQLAPGFEVLRALNQSEQLFRRARKHFSSVEMPPTKFKFKADQRETPAVLEVGSEIESGAFLLAHPSITDPLWSSSVVYITNHDQEEGTLGYILNKPLGNPLKSEKQTANEIAQLCSMGLAEARQKTGVCNHLLSSSLSEHKLFLGGPVCEADSGPNHIHFAKQTQTPSSSSSEEDDGNLPDIELLAPHVPETQDAGRLLLGCCFWVPGQLDREIERSEWILVKPPPMDAGIRQSLLHFAMDSPSSLDLYFRCLDGLGGDFRSLFATLVPSKAHATKPDQGAEDDLNRSFISTPSPQKKIKTKLI